MKHLFTLSVMTALMAAAPFDAQAREAEGEPDDVFWTASDCANPPDAPAMRIELSDVKSDKGNIRVALYNMDDDEFLASGARIARIDVGAEQGDMDICLPLPHAGSFAMAILHDENANGRLDVFSEGYGFPNNPRLMFSPPNAKEAGFAVQDGETVVLPITMKYVYPKKNTRGPRRR